MRVAVVGAGVAGLSCASRFASLAAAVSVFDKGRGPAGRMASRRLPTPLGEADFDMGAPAFSVRDPRFAAEAARWRALGLAAPWPEAGPDAWVGVPRMSAPLTALAAGLDVRWNAFVGGVSRTPEGWRLHLRDEEVGPFEAVAIALPAEQAAPLLALNAPSFGARVLTAVSRPCWTGLFAFDRPLSDDAVLLRDQGILDLAVRNSVKPGRSGPEAWVVHARADWSAAHLEEDAACVADALRLALAKATGSQALRPVAGQAHRWRVARPAGLGSGFLWDAAVGLGACGDWLAAPTVEGAWLSGLDLAEQIALNPRTGPSRGRAAKRLMARHGAMT